MGGEVPSSSEEQPTAKKKATASTSRPLYSGSCRQMQCRASSSGCQQEYLSIWRTAPAMHPWHHARITRPKCSSRDLLSLFSIWSIRGCQCSAPPRTISGTLQSAAWKNLVCSLLLSLPLGRYLGGTLRASAFPKEPSLRKLGQPQEPAMYSLVKEASFLHLSRALCACTEHVRDQVAKVGSWDSPDLG